MTKNTPSSSFIPPVVSVLGHVDHGKTTLLDTIRKSTIAAREHGGITQKIGASSVEILRDGQKQSITFIDTPGHAAFSNMRSRGAKVADIALLIISSVDGVMPQTKESIELLKKDTIPYIVVLTKSDSPEKNPEKVKQQLARENILLEGYGGDVPVIEVSARQNTNIKELLDLILLVWEMHKQTHKTDESLNAPLQAIVIESKLDIKSGPKATIVIKQGEIGVKDEISTRDTKGKVRSLITDAGAFIQKAYVGQAVEVLGFEKVPVVGSILSKGFSSNQDNAIGAYSASSAQAGDTKMARAANVAQAQGAFAKRFDSQGEKSLSLILVADTQGSLEAIIASLPKEVGIRLQKTGEVSEADILLAKSTGAIVLTFNTKLKPDIIKFAQIEKVLLKNYTIIYEMLDEIGQVLEGKALAAMEQIYGVVKIQASFPFEKTKVLGVSVLDGRVARGDKVRLMRGESVIGESMITSLRQGKNQTSKVEKGNECGVLINPLLDFTIGDMLVSHS